MDVPEQLTVGGHRLRLHAVAGSGLPIVVLHGGLDSLSTLRDFPSALAAATGHPVVAYDRMGHGRSEPLPAGASRPDDNRQVEADTLADLLHQLAITEAVLVGHSDGGAIALLAAGRHPERIAGVVALAPQLVNHDVVQGGIRRAVEAFRRGPLRAALSDHHDDVDGVFAGWSGVWLRAVYSPASVRADLAAVACPVTVLSCLDDPYGFRPNVALLAECLQVPFGVSVTGSGGHLPHHTCREQVFARTADLLGQVRSPDAPPGCGDGCGSGAD